MKLFGQIVRTVVNTALLPVAAAADVVTGGGIFTGHNDGYDEPASLKNTFTGKALQRLKDEAEERRRPR